MSKKIALVLLALMLVATGLLGCTPAGTTKDAGTTAATTKGGDPAVTTAPADEEKELVTIQWHMASWGAVRDEEEVNAAIAEIVKEKLNIDLKLNVYVYADYDQKVSTMVNAGQKMDILFTSATIVPFLTNVRQGNFIPLDDLLAEYAPKTFADIPEGAWAAATVDGSIYGVVPLKDLADVHSLQVDMDLFEEMGLVDMLPAQHGWQTPYDLEDMIYAAHDKRNELYPEMEDHPSISLHRNNMQLFYPMEKINFVVACNIEDTPGGFAGKGNGETAFNFIDTDEYRKFAHFMQDLTDHGVFAYDPDNFDPDGVLDVRHTMRTSQGIVTDDKAGTWPKQVILPREAFMTNEYVRAQMNAIAATCEHPERAMELIEFFNQDKEVATMLRFGIEGKHWKPVSDMVLTFEGTENEDPKNRGFYYWYGTTWGSFRNVMMPDFEDPDMVDKVIETTVNGNMRGNLGFNFSEEPVINEIAACRNVFDEFNKTIYNALADDVDATVDEFIAKLAANGVDKIVDEVQNQLTEWRKEVGRPAKD